MTVLITGAAGNLGGRLSRHLAAKGIPLRVMWHRRRVAADVAGRSGVEAVRADLGDPASLRAACRGVDALIHFAGVLFRPRPESFLHRTNAAYGRNLVDAAREEGVRRFVLASFPHVEGESTPDRPSRGGYAAMPASVHARTRRAEEEYVFAASGRSMTPVSLRCGMVYARGVLMVDAARWFARRRLLGVWTRPTWIHLIALPDFLDAAEAALTRPGVEGIYNMGDDEPVTLQRFLDVAARRWGVPGPWRAPAWAFHFAGWACEMLAAAFHAPSPLTRDFIRIGMASYAMDTSRMRRDLLPAPRYPSLKEGVVLL